MISLHSLHTLNNNGSDLDFFFCLRSEIYSEILAVILTVDFVFLELVLFTLM